MFRRSPTGRRLRLTMLGTTIACGAIAMGAASASATVTIQGQWQCRDRGVTMPIRGAMVELHETGVFGNHLTASVATTFTDDNGNYSLTTSHGGDHFVRLVLRDAQGVHLND